MPTNPGSPILDLEPVDTATPNGPRYSERVEQDGINNTNLDTIDAFAGWVTASFSTVLRTSGTVSEQLASDIGSAYATYNRVITGVKAWHARSGSGGVTTVNVLRQEDGVGGALVSIYSNAAFYPAVSQSLGNYGIASGGTISGSLWKAGTVIVARPTTAGATSQDLHVQILWRPSGSYGAI